MMMPVIGVGKPSRVARRPRSVPCRPAPNINTPIPRSNGQVDTIELKRPPQTERRNQWTSPGRPPGSVLPDAAQDDGQVFIHIDGLIVLVDQTLGLAPIEQKRIDHT